MVIEYSSFKLLGSGILNANIKLAMAVEFFQILLSIDAKEDT